MMGLKSKLNKMKSFLFDEEEVEEKPVKKNVKKIIKEEEIKIEEPKAELDRTKEMDNLYLEDLSEAEPEVKQEIKSRVVKNEPEFKFPEFDDDDFMVSRKKPEPIIKPVIKEEAKPVLYQGSKRKEETKKFKPSPIISPVYGLLDNEGNKVEKKTEKKEVSLKSKEELTFDDIRKKAYGNLDEEIENTLKRLSKKTIAEAEDEMKKEENELSREKKKAKKLDKEDVTLVKVDDEDDDMILPNVNFKEIDVDKERNKMPSKKSIVDKNMDDDDEDDTKEQDLFNLIDTMYQGEEKED